MGAIKERRTTTMLEKSRGIRRGLDTVLVMGALALAFCLATPRAAHAQTANLQVLAVNPLDFGSGTDDDNEVIATCTETAASDPVLFYDNTVTGTSAIDVLLVTISAIGDADRGSRLEVQCKVDGAPCKTGNIGDDGATKVAPATPPPPLVPDGWAMLQRFADTAGEDENSVNYTWCVPIKKTSKNAHHVTLSLANIPGSGTCPGTAGDVSLEQVNVIVEGFHAGVSKLGKNACTSVGVSEHNS
jgi:hypothetical protein